MAKKGFLQSAQRTITKPKDEEFLDAQFEPTSRSERQGRRLKGARELPIEKIKPDPNQPRTNFDEGALQELANSIKKHGVRQPIEVEYKEDGDFFQIVSGERRYRASQIAGLDHMPCVIREVADKDRLAIQLIENIQREDLSPIDKARGLLEYKRSLGPKAQWKEVDEITGISERRRRQFLALLDLPENIQDEIVGSGNDKTIKNIVTEKHARALLKLKRHPDKQQELFNRLKSTPEHISGDDAIKIARQMVEPQKSTNEKLVFTYTSIPDLITQLKQKLKELEKTDK